MTISKLYCLQRRVFYIHGFSCPGLPRFTLDDYEIKKGSNMDTGVFFYSNQLRLRLM